MQPHACTGRNGGRLDSPGHARASLGRPAEEGVHINESHCVGPAGERHGRGCKRLMLGTGIGRVEGIGWTARRDGVLRESACCGLERAAAALAWYVERDRWEGKPRRAAAEIAPRAMMTA